MIGLLTACPRRRAVPGLILFLFCLITAAADNSGLSASSREQPETAGTNRGVLSGDRGFDLELSLAFEQFRTDIALRYSFTDYIEAGPVFGLGPMVFLPYDDTRYEGYVLTTGLVMARAGLFARLPFTPVPFLTITPQIEGLIRWEANYTRVASTRHEFTREELAFPWVLEADFTLEADISTGKLFGIRFLEPLTVNAGFYTPVSDVLIMYDRFMYWIGISWKFF